MFLHQNTSSPHVEKEDANVNYDTPGVRKVLSLSIALFFIGTAFAQTGL